MTLEIKLYIGRIPFRQQKVVKGGENKCRTPEYNLLACSILEPPKTAQYYSSQVNQLK